MAVRRRILVAGGVGVAALIVFVLVWFEPQALFIDEEVNEAAPTAVSTGGSTDSSAGTAGTAGTATTAAASAETVLAGSFVSQEHSTSGRAVVIELPGGGRTLRFEGLDTSNGPDLRVYLSTAQADADWKAFDDDFVELGDLKGNKGDQNYEIPAGVDLSRYGRAVIWCKRFSVPFGVADLKGAA